MRLPIPGIDDIIWLYRSPVLGQGVNLALQDALALSQILKNYLGQSNQQQQHQQQNQLSKAMAIHHALHEYSQQRKNIFFFYQSVSKWLNPWYFISFIHLSIYLHLYLHLILL